jgi:hypothetical protein
MPLVLSRHVATCSVSWLNDPAQEVIPPNDGPRSIVLWAPTDTPRNNPGCLGRLRPQAEATQIVEGFARATLSWE